MLREGIIKRALQLKSWFLHYWRTPATSKNSSPKTAVGRAQQESLMLSCEALHLVFSPYPLMPLIAGACVLERKMKLLYIIIGAELWKGKVVWLFTRDRSELAFFIMELKRNFLKSYFSSCFMLHWSKIKIGQLAIDQQSFCAPSYNCFQAD